MEEVLPGVHHWTAEHPRLKIEVSCHFLAGSATAIDPLLPEDGMDWFRRHRPSRVVLSNRHHLRHSERLADAFGCPILCHESGLYEFEHGPQVQGFAFGDRLADDLTALEMNSICPDDTVLRIDAGGGALLFADSLIHHGEVGFVPDNLIGDGAEARQGADPRPRRQAFGGRVRQPALRARHASDRRGPRGAARRGGKLMAGRVRAAAVLAALLLAAAGCGGSDEGASRPPAGLSPGRAEAPRQGFPAGEWQGRLAQRGLPPFQMRASIRSRTDPSRNTVAYTGIECRGNWDYLGRRGPDFRFREVIDRGRGGKCKGAGTVTLRYIGPDRLRYEFRGGGVASSGFIRPAPEPGVAA